MATRTTKHLDRVASPGLNPADLLALIVKERSKDVDAVPPGFLTTDQWAEKWGIERTRSADLLAYAVKQGLAERQSFRIMCGKKRCPVAHFKQLKKG
jgi:hypothetical protein